MDLTAIKTPFGLLELETQTALIEHGPVWEFWNGMEWEQSRATKLSDFDPACAYRVKPAPPRERWIVGREAFETYAQAANICEHGEQPIHVREVMP